MTSKLVIGFAVAILTTFLMPASEALAVCCGSDCCCVDGSIQGPGDTNPDNPCQVCDPSQSQMAWSEVPDCVADAGVSEEDAGTAAEEDAGTAAEEDAGTASEEDAGSSTEMDGGPTGDDSGSRDDGGCAAGGGGAFGGLFGLLLLGLRRKKGVQ